jgi:hypothetical protein
MKNFKKFLEEVDIKGNPGIPGEGPKRQGERNYLGDVENRALNRLQLNRGDMQTVPGRPSQTEMRLGRRLMELVPQSIQMSAGYERQLSELATNVIRNLYQEIIDRYDIELDIRLVRPGTIKDFMDEDEEQDEPDMPQFREIKDENIRKEIHKRKIANLIIQGEAKNTKHLLHTEEVKDGLKEILGNRNGERLFTILDEITKTADKLDWIIPEEIKAQMMEEMPDGMAGACKVGWKPKEKEEDDEEEKEVKIDMGDDKEDEEGQEEDTPLEQGETPILRARGVDFSMLLHEAVKGLFEILSLGGIPEDKEVSKLVISNTGMGDEPQDFKYGPEVASDLRDFVNENNKVDKYPNVREELWKLMIDKESMPTDQFLELMRGILSKTDKAKRDVDRLLDKVIKMIEEEKAGLDDYNKKMDEYERQLKDYEEEKNRPRNEYEEEEGEFANGNEEETDIDKLVKQSLNNKDDDQSDSGEPDYSKMSPRELDRLMNQALDDENYALAHKISQYTKSESRKVYQRELKIINEKLNPHQKLR